MRPAKGLINPNRSPTKWVRFGKEEQRHERALIFAKKSEQAIQSLLRRGAGDRTRTGTLSPAVDFESTTSTNSITPAGASGIIHETDSFGKRKEKVFLRKKEIYLTSCMFPYSKRIEIVCWC